MSIGVITKLAKYADQLINLLGPAAANILRYQSPYSSSLTRSIAEKLGDLASIRDFGAVADGVTDDSAAALDMMAQEGYVRFTRGNYVLNTCQLGGPVVFDRKANITVNSGQTVTINGSITSDRQNIFKGAGTYVLGHDNTLNTGEEARGVHASWFGAFPRPQPGPDQGPFIQKACDAMGNGRESIIDFDIGNYNMESGVVTTRGCWIRGSGTRRTVFKTSSDGFSLFTTGNTACRFSNFGFELHLGVITTRVSPYITLNHDACDAYDLAMGQTQRGIVCNALRYRIRNVIAAYGAQQAVGSSLIEMNAGQGHVADIYCLTSGLGPETVVRVGAAATGTMTDLLIENIDSVLPSRLVTVTAQTGNIGSMIINKLRYGGSSGTAPAELVLMETTGSSSLTGVQLTDMYATTYIPNVINVIQGSSGSTEDIVFDDIVVRGASVGTGIALRKNAGAMDNITIGSGVQLKEKTTPFLLENNPTNVNIAPEALPGARAVTAYDAEIDDDSFAIIDLRHDMYTGMLGVTAAGTNGILLVMRAAPTPAATVMFATANVNATNVALNGTTGVDGKLTVGVTANKLYIENRLGSTQRVAVIPMSGV